MDRQEVKRLVGFGSQNKARRLIPYFVIAVAVSLLAACSSVSVPEVSEDPRDPEPQVPPADWVRIGSEDDAASITSQQPAGTIFFFEAGTHRLSRPITPRTGDVFLGGPGAVLSGARLLTDFSSEEGLWVVRHQAQEGALGSGSCDSDSPRCRYPEELFIDDVRLKHVDSRSQVGSGTWYFDYGADAIYFYDDPRGRRVETSVVRAAIVGDADDVTISGLVVEKFANPAQHGALMPEKVATNTTYGHRWLIENNVVRLNHGVGVRAGFGAVVRNNVITHNGQLGVASYGGRDTLFEGNEIAYNNAVGYSVGWEAGGSKFVKTTGLVVRGNHVHNNYGPGLWTDIDNVDTIYEYNLVENNESTGIFHEISHSASIRYNIVRDNASEAGLNKYAYVFGAGILVYTSKDVEVYGNLVSGNWNGIVGLMHERGSGDFGRYELRNLNVHDNQVELAYHPNGVGPQGEKGVWAVTGVAQAGGFNFVFEDSAANQFWGNEYFTPELTAPTFTWYNGGRSFQAWTATYEQDAGATIAVGSLTDALAQK